MNQINILNKKIIEKIKNQTIFNKRYYKNIDKNYLRCIETKNIYKQKIYESGNNIVNKFFAYELLDISNKHKNIQIINKGFDNIDLFDLVKKDKYFDGYETITENILNFLSNKGVKNIVIYDFTCYSFLPNNKISDRMVRSFRKEINNKLNYNNTY